LRTSEETRRQYLFEFSSVEEGLRPTSSYEIGPEGVASENAVKERMKRANVGVKRAKLLKAKQLR